MKGFAIYIYKRKCWKNMLSAFLLILVLANMSLIFAFSSENATESSDRSDGVADKVASIIVDGYDKMDDIKRENEREKFQLPIRKVAHFSIFASLGGFVTFLIYSLEITKFRFTFSIPLLVGLIWAIIDETHQIFSDGRGPSWIDVIIDFAGVFTSTLIINLVAIAVIRKFKARLPALKTVSDTTEA